MPPSVQGGELSPVLQAAGSYVGLGSVVLCWVYCRFGLGCELGGVVLGQAGMGWIALGGIGLG